MEDRCICCGDIIPEGRMVCPICEKEEFIMVNNEDEDVMFDDRNVQNVSYMELTRINKNLEKVNENLIIIQKLIRKTFIDND